MHRLAAGFVLAYHGCDLAVGERLLDGDAFLPSKNDYDWLGPGIYFWEANPVRGLEFAQEASRSKRATIKVPFVIGAVIELGLCLDLLTKAGIELVKTAYESLASVATTAGLKLPENAAGGLRRNLDCAHQTGSYTPQRSWLASGGYRPGGLRGRQADLPNRRIQREDSHPNRGQ